MPQGALAAILIAHGFITSMIAVGGLTNPNGPAMQLPSWFNWWPGPFGRSWLFDSLNLGSTASIVGGLVWLAAGMVLVAGGLGGLGVSVVRDSWPQLTIAGAALGLLAAILYFHPLYAIAVAINVALVVLLWTRPAAVM